MGTEENNLGETISVLEYKTAITNCENILAFWCLKYMDSDNPKIKHSFKVLEKTNEMEIKFTLSLDKKEREKENEN